MNRTLNRLYLRATTPLFFNPVSFFFLNAMGVTASRGVPLLVYHRVAPLGEFQFLGTFRSGRVSRYRLCCVEPRRFAQQIEMLLHRGYEFKTVAELSDAPSSSLTRTVALTFDDIFYDSQKYLIPILKKYRIKATLFFVSDMIERETLLWQHRLYHGISTLSEEIFFKALRDAIKEFGGMNDLDVYNTFRRKLSLAEKNDILARIHPIANERELAKEIYLSKRDLKVMSDGPIEVASHSVSHQYMGELDDEAYLLELTQSKADLEEISEKPVHSFSYPFNSYKDEDGSLLVQAGYKVACTVNESRFELVGSGRRSGRINIREEDSQATILRMVSTQWKRDTL